MTYIDTTGAVRAEHPRPLWAYFVISQVISLLADQYEALNAARQA